MVYTLPVAHNGPYYDILYQDRDYPQEVDYLLKLVNEEGLQIKRLLEFGSGTGNHGIILANRGFHVTGLERSAAMFERANGKLTGLLSLPPGSSLQFVLGDAKEFRLEQSFDAVFSLFHVVSYQTTDLDLAGFFANAWRHLSVGGVFVFDVWHGPAVLEQRPSSRFKRVVSGDFEVSRQAVPELIPDSKVVKIDYTLDVKNLSSGKVERTTERHVMRYFFVDEIDDLARRSGFEVVLSEEWLTGARPSGGSWGVCYVLKKLKGGAH